MPRPVKAVANTYPNSDNKIDLAACLWLILGLIVWCQVWGCAAPAKAHAAPQPQLYHSYALRACALPVQVVTPRGFPFLEEAVQEATTRWNERVGQKWFTAEPAPTRVRVSVRALADRFLAVTRYGHQHGCSRSLKILVSPKLVLGIKSPKLGLILTHEFGHVLGLGHVPERIRLMWPYIPRTLYPEWGVITDDEISLIKRLQNCPAARRFRDCQVRRKRYGK